MLSTGSWVSQAALEPHGLGNLSLGLSKMPLVSGSGLTLLRLLLSLLLWEALELLLRLELLLLWLELLLLSLLELLLWLELLLRLELLLLRLDTLPSGIKVRSLSVRLELWGLLLELLLWLDLVESVEVILAPRLLLEPVPLLLLLLCPDLLLADFLLPLSFSLLCESLLFRSLALPQQLSLDNLGQSLDIQAEEHVECMLLSFFRQGGELCLAVLLEVWPERQVLLVESCLLLPVESLPRGGVCEGLESELLDLQLLGDSEPLAGSQHQLVCVGQVDVTKMSDESLPLLS